MSSDALIRTIVWWAPHSGHWDTSSNRWRQKTQRSRPGSWVGLSQGSPHSGQEARLPKDSEPGSFPLTSTSSLFRLGRPTDDRAPW